MSVQKIEVEAARQLVRKGEVLIARQRAIVLHLATIGKEQSLAEARSVLEVLESTQAQSREALADALAKRASMLAAIKAAAAQ